MSDINRRCENELKRLKKKILKSQSLEKYLTLVNVYSKIAYEYSQFYCDTEIEDSLNKKSSMYFENVVFDNPKQDTIMFFDSFGDDVRGLAAIYLRALIQLNKTLIYVVDERAKDTTPEITKLLAENEVSIVYFSSHCSYCAQVKRITEIVSQYSPGVIFEYIFPDDVAPIFVFNRLTKVKRYLINLTDHAFWIGLKSFDYCIEFRDFGANVSTQFRGISKEKDLLLPYYPYVKNTEMRKLPFDIENVRVVVSGGALYKTFSEDNKYYLIIEYILKKYEDTIFLFIGNGDTSSINSLKNMFPNRVFHMNERDDFYEIIKRSYVYINTYPLIGGLMTQYSAMAGKIPVTLLFEGEKCDVLFKWEELPYISFEFKTIIEEIDKIFTDKAYKKTLETDLNTLVVTETKFNNALEYLVENDKSIYSAHLVPFNIKEVSKKFLEKLNGYDFDEYFSNKITRKRNWRILYLYPVCFLKKIKSLRKYYSK